MNNRRLYISIVVILLLFSCQEKEILIDSEEKAIFLKSEGLGYYKGGSSVLLYDKSRHQIVINFKRHLFRLQSDAQEEYINVMLETIPRSQGNHIIISFMLFSGEGAGSYVHLFECSRMSNDKMWFWNADTKQGIIIPML